MSITSDVKTYADAAIEQAKQVVDQAQARLAKSAGDASKYVAQAKARTGAVAGKAEGLVRDLRHDSRLEKPLDEAEAAATTIVGTVNEKVVAPALTLIGRGTNGTTHTVPTPRPTKASPTNGTTKKAPATKATATKAPATKATAKKAPAKKAPAKKAPATKATAK